MKKEKKEEIPKQFQFLGKNIKYHGLNPDTSVGTLANDKQYPVAPKECTCIWIGNKVNTKAKIDQQYMLN